MKHAMSYVIVAAITLLAACAGAPKKADATARCNEAPQWVTKDAAGNSIGIFVCFGEENRLLYTARVLPPPPPAPAASPLTDDEKHFLEVGKAEVARLKAITDNGIKSAKKPASTPAPAAPPATPLPTLGGTAQ
jgi:hypothetical protein